MINKRVRVLTMPPTWNAFKKVYGCSASVMDPKGPRCRAVWLFEEKRKKDLPSESELQSLCDQYIERHGLVRIG